MKQFIVLFFLVSVFGCAATVAKDDVASCYDDFPVQILNSLTTCGENTCTVAVKVQAPTKRLAGLTCLFRPQGLNIPPIMMDAYEKPQTVASGIIQTVVSKVCRTAGSPNELTINCGQSSFVWSTPIDMSDPAIAQIVYRSIGDKMDFVCSAE